jgi:hypothetical protein
MTNIVFFQFWIFYFVCAVSYFNNLKTVLKPEMINIINKVILILPNILSVISTMINLLVKFNIRLIIIANIKKINIMTYFLNNVL